MVVFLYLSLMLFVTHIILSIVISSQCPDNVKEAETCTINSWRSVEIGVLNSSKRTYLLSKPIIVLCHKLGLVNHVGFFNYSDKLLSGDLRRKGKKWVIK